MTDQRVSLITGGAGFIGTNLAHHLMENGNRVLLFDNLSRRGVRQNLDWLMHRHGEQLSVIVADVRDPQALQAATDGADEVYHLAAQVAVTTSLEDPRGDFDVNAQGTLNLLEALRARKNPPPLLYTSTNKVYGALPDVSLRRTASRYVPADAGVLALGINEQRPLDFHSPYGCSKGCADQYVLDYARTFGLNAAVFRMSCIYGAHQHGTEDQGWVAHFLIRAKQHAPITIFGDGLQVRDVLYVDDLVAAFMLAMKNIYSVAGQAFNIGGGPSNTLSLTELVAWLSKLDTQAPEIRRTSSRLGDQRYYVSDTTKFSSATGWQPRVSVTDGLTRLANWLSNASASCEQPVAPFGETARHTAIGAAR